MYNLGEAVGYIRLEMGKFLSEAQQAQTATKDIENEFDKLGNTAKSIEGIIVKSFAAIGAAVVAGLGQAVNVGSQFEASMSQVAATMGMTADDVANGSADFEKLSAAAKEMGETTKFSASQAADALNYLALAGYDTEQAISTLPTVLNLAASGGMDLARASDMITDAASALGLGLDDMSLFADKMAKAAQSSNTSVEQLGDAILQIGGTAKNLSGGVTELNTALGILANNGIKAAEGGTALRQIVLNLTAPTEKAAAYMEELGLKVADAAGNVRPLNEIFKDLDEILQSKGITGSADKIKALSTIFDARQLKSANALLANYGESWDRLYDKIDNAEGASARMAETMETNLRGALTILGSTAEGFGITVYDSIESSFKNAVTEATKQLSNLNQAFKSDEMQASMQKISDAISDAIVKLSEFLGETIPKLVSGLSDLIDNFDKISAGIAGLATTIGLATAGMALYKIQTDLVTQSLIAQKIAQLAANAAALANPYTLVAVGIGVLVGALVAEYNQQQENIRQLDELNQKYYDAEAAVNTMADNYDKEIAKAKELENSRDNEINQVNELLSIIEKNVDETGKIISNTEMVKDAIDELNGIIPVNLEYRDNQIINYGELTQASKDYCEQLKTQAILEARQEEYKTAAVAYDEAIKKREDLTNAFYEAQKAYQDVDYAWQKMNNEINGYVAKYQEEAKAAGMSYRDYVNAMHETTKKALDSTQDAYLENERIIQETRQIVEDGETEITRLTNEIYRTQLESGQEVTGLFRTEAEARIGVAELEAERLAEIARQGAQSRVEAAESGADDMITSEEDLEAALEQLEIDFNTGVIGTEKEYHAKRLELLENFHGEWNKKNSAWLKQEVDYAAKQAETAAKAAQQAYEKAKRQLAKKQQEEEKQRQEEEREKEREKREAEQAEKEKNKNYFENLKYRADTDKEYTKEMYKSDLIAFQATLKEGTDLYRQVGREIVNVDEDIAKQAEQTFEESFETLKKQKGEISWDDYIDSLNDFAETLDKTSDLYNKVMDEITEAEKQKAKAKAQTDKDAFEEYKRRKRDEKDYTDAMYIADLTAFSKTLDKKSDLYEDVLDEIDKTNKTHLQGLKDYFEINEGEGYTLEDYLNDLNEFLATLEEGSEAYIETQKEIRKVQDKIKAANQKAAEDEKKRIEDNNKQYLQSLKNKQKEDNTYTKQMYLNDLLAFAETLDKESDLYQTVLNEIATVRKEISDENQKSADTAFKSWESGFNSLKSEAEKAYNEIIKKQQSLEDTLNKSIKLFETKTKRVKNLQTGLYEEVTTKTTSTSFLKNQIKDLNDYTKQLQTLEKRGVSKELMAEIMGMSEEDRKDYVKALNQMSDSSLKAYDDAYSAVRKKNKEFAESYYEDELEEFKTNWGDKIKAYIETLPEDAKSAAKELIENFVTGLSDTDADADESNNAFNDLFAGLVSSFSDKIASGDLFKNYGTKSVENLETEVKDSSESLNETTEKVGEDAGGALGFGFATGMDDATDKVKKQSKTWGKIISENVLEPLKEIKAMYDSIFGYNIPQNILTGNSITTNTKAQPTTVVQQNQLTQKDIENAIKNSIPSGDVIMRVDGDKFAQISRKQLNILAQKNGRLGLNV